MLRSAPAALALLLAGCSPADVPADDTAPVAEIPTLEPPPAGQGFQVSITGVAPARSETWLCIVYDLETTDLAAVNRVEFLQNEGTHHMTLSTTALSTTPLEPGTYDCADLYTTGDVMQDVVMIFGNQGTAEGTLELPEGVAALVPAGIQLVHEVHYVNGSDTDVQLYSYLNGWTIPTSEVTDSIWGSQVRDETIEIPAHDTHTEWTRCVMNEDVEVHFLASHSHALGRSFTIAPFDGETTGEVFYENTDWHDPLIIQYPDPIVVPAGQGFEYACTWENDSDAPVSYGYTAADEMCNMTLVYTPGSPSARCEVVETSDGVLWVP